MALNNNHSGQKERRKWKNLSSEKTGRGEKSRSRKDVKSDSIGGEVRQRYCHKSDNKPRDFWIETFNSNFTLFLVDFDDFDGRGRRKWRGKGTIGGESAIGSKHGNCIIADSESNNESFDRGLVSN